MRPLTLLLNWTRPPGSQRRQTRSPTRAREAVTSWTLRSRLTPRLPPILSLEPMPPGPGANPGRFRQERRRRSEEHTSELQSPCNLVCRLLLEKKKKIKDNSFNQIKTKQQTT